MKDKVIKGKVFKCKVCGGIVGGDVKLSELDKIPLHKQYRGIYTPEYDRIGNEDNLYTPRHVICLKCFKKAQAEFNTFLVKFKEKYRGPRFSFALFNTVLMEHFGYPL